MYVYCSNEWSFKAGVTSRGQTIIYWRTWACNATLKHIETRFKTLTTKNIIMCGHCDVIIIGDLNSILTAALTCLRRDQNRCLSMYMWRRYKSNLMHSLTALLNACDINSSKGCTWWSELSESLSENTKSEIKRFTWIHEAWSVGSKC